MSLRGRWLRCVGVSAVWVALTSLGCGQDVDEDNWYACKEVPDGSECDCNDFNAGQHPRHDEVCDGIDNNCDGEIDEHLLVTLYPDADGDGQGDIESDQADLITGCIGSTDTADVGGDCDDGDPLIYGGAPELCDGLDNDCDEAADEGVTLDAYPDRDQDGHGDTEALSEGVCLQSDGDLPPGYSAVSDDCDDANPDIHPGQTENCGDSTDNDCNPFSDDMTGATVRWEDRDGDGFGGGEGELTCQSDTRPVLVGGDCDDRNPKVNPDAAEVCDIDGSGEPVPIGSAEALDNDCDGRVDEGQPWIAYWPDADADQYGRAVSDELGYCEQQLPSTSQRLSPNNLDCDDTRADIQPEAEDCGLVDCGCDGIADAESEIDHDGDGFSRYQGDLNDGDAAVFPGAVEVCDGKDNDLDLQIDNTLETIEYFPDFDGDGYGSRGGADSLFMSSCRVFGYAANADDCDDDDPASYPGAPERCDGKDNGCVAGGAGDEVVVSIYPDVDGDGYGDSDHSGLPVLRCEVPAGWSEQGGDCDDGDNSTYPGAVEGCDGRDNNCDGAVDEELAVGCDNDTLAPTAGATAPPETPASPLPQEGTSSSSPGPVASQTPGISETATPEATPSPDHQTLSPTPLTPIPSPTAAATPSPAGGSPTPSSTPPLDKDGDGHAEPEDCNDNDAAVYPGAMETCQHRQDTNCDGAIGAVDQDGDGYVACSECNDLSALVHPGMYELCDGADNDCDGESDEGLGVETLQDCGVDADGDGFRVADGDCDDANGAVNPQALEICYDGIDNNCDERGCLLLGTHKLKDVSVLLTHGLPIRVGMLVHGIGDFDNNGFNEVMIGSEGGIYGTGSSNLYKQFFSVDASYIKPTSTTISLTQVGYFLRWQSNMSGKSDPQTFGGPLGDFNGDGQPELYAAGSAPNSFLYLHGTKLHGLGGTLAAFDQNQYIDFSRSVGIPDQDLDGIDEVLVISGRGVSMFSGVDLVEETVNPSPLGEWLNDQCTHAQCVNHIAVGDWNCDDQPDLAISFSQDYDSVVVFPGPHEGEKQVDDAPIQFGLTPAQGVGSSDQGVANLGDLNGDACDDLGLSEPTSRDNHGVVVVVSGRAGLSGFQDLSDESSYEAFVYGSTEGDELGTCSPCYPQSAQSVMRGGTDVNGDGYDDLLIGNPLNDRLGENRGAVYLFLGPVTSGSEGIDAIEADLTLLGTDETANGVGESAGNSLDWVGNMLGDPAPDIAVGAPRAADEAGIVYVVNMSPF